MIGCVHDSKMYVCIIQIVVYRYYRIIIWIANFLAVIIILVIINYACRLVPRGFNSYGSRRGNDDVMARGTFANIRLVNKFIGKAAPKTTHIPSNEQVR